MGPKIIFFLGGEMENICLRKQMIWGNFTRLKMRWYYTGKITDWQKCLIVFKWVSANHCKNDLLIESPKWRIITLVSLTTNYFLLLPNYGKEQKCTKIKKQNWKRFLISIFFFFIYIDHWKKLWCGEDNISGCHSDH